MHQNLHHCRFQKSRPIRNRPDLFPTNVSTHDLPSTYPAPVPRQGTGGAKVTEVTRGRKSFGTSKMAAVRTWPNHITALGLSFPPSKMRTVISVVQWLRNVEVNIDCPNENKQRLLM